MDNHVDDALRRLARAPVHPQLAASEAEVFLKIASPPAGIPGGALRTGAVAGVAAVTMGVIAAGLPGPAAEASPLPLGLETPLVSSALLTGL